MKPLTNLLRNFSPSYDFNKNYLALCEKFPKKTDPFLIALKKDDHNVYSYETRILNDSSNPVYKELTFNYIERLTKCLLWMRGGHTFFIHTPNKLFFNTLKKIYSPEGERAWDVFFIVEQIYGKALDFVDCSKEDFPKSKRSSIKIGGHTNGHRLGLDLGGSDKKIAAVSDGKVLLTQSILWNPFEQKDLHWHIREITEALDIAASYLPQVDAIGVSIPGISENNEIKVSSIFQGLSKENQLKARDLFKTHIQKKWNVPMGIANDGDVSALFGSLKYREKNLLAIAMGTSMACGYVNEEGSIENSFNEFAFVPIDHDKNAPKDPWSNDIGCGSQYFSQQAVYRLAKELELPVNQEKTLAENLIIVQNLAEKNTPEALQVFRVIGIYLCYALAHYKQFYKIDSLVLLGRVLKGQGGNTIIETAKEHMKEKFPNLNITIYSLSEEETLHSQAVSAASIPLLSK